MICYTDKKDIHKHLNTENIGAIDIGGICHQGHFFVISECKKLVDILVVIYVAWNQSAIGYYTTGKWSTDITEFDSIISSIQKNQTMVSDIDFLVYSPLTEYIKEQIVYNEKNKELCYTFCKELGVPGLWKHVILSPIYDNDLRYLNYYTGPKNILTDLISRKILNTSDVYDPKYIWKSLRNKTTHSMLSRTSSDSVLGYIIKSIFDEIQLNGGVDVSYLNTIKKKFSYIKNLDIPIINMETIERINTTTNNCIISCNFDRYADFLFIQDGNIVF